MITITVNGESKALAVSCTVAEALEAWGYQGQKIAIAVNNRFVPRSEYQARMLRQEDCIDIVVPVQGG